VRARVTVVQVLIVKWHCRFCGCEAGSMGTAAAAAAAAAAVAHHGGRSGGGGNFDEKTKPPISALTALARCSACRPPPGAFTSAAAAAAAAELACGFGVELSVTLDDGSAQADCWIAGTAGDSLLPPSLKVAALALARRHGCVSARVMNNVGGGDQSGRNGVAGYVLRGFSSLSMGEVEGAPLLAAVGHAESLGEMLLQVRLDYKKFDEAGLPSRSSNSRGLARSQKLPDVHILRNPRKYLHLTGGNNLNQRLDRRE